MAWRWIWLATSVLITPVLDLKVLTMVRNKLPKEMVATNDVELPVGKRLTITLTPSQGQPGGIVRLKGTVRSCVKELGFWRVVLVDLERKK